MADQPALGALLDTITGGRDSEEHPTHAPRQPGEPDPLADRTTAPVVPAPSAGTQRLRAARFQPQLVVGVAVAYLPTALSTEQHRVALVTAGALLALVGTGAWLWAARRPVDHRHRDQLALLLAAIGLAALAALVLTATPATAARLLPFAVLLLCVGALSPVRWTRRLLQVSACALGLAVAVVMAVPWHELLLVGALLVVIGWTATAFAGDLIAARRAHRQARAEARQQSALLLAVQQLPREQPAAALAGIRELLGEHDLDLIAVLPAIEPGDDARTGPATPAGAVGPRMMIVVPDRLPGRADTTLVVQRRTPGPFRDAERSLIEVLASHLGAIRFNAARVGRQHELLLRLTGLERTRGSFLESFTDELEEAVATVRRTARGLTGDALAPEALRQPESSPGPHVPGPATLPGQLGELVTASGLLYRTIEAMFALAHAHRGSGAQLAPRTRTELATALLDAGWSVRTTGPDITMHADLTLLVHAVGLWAPPPAALEVTTTAAGLTLTSPAVRAPVTGDELAGRLVLAAGGRCSTDASIVFAAAVPEPRPWV